jgi:hypothetical protein
MDIHWMEIQLYSEEAEQIRKFWKFFQIGMECFPGRVRATVGREGAAVGREQHSREGAAVGREQWKDML